MGTVTLLQQLTKQVEAEVKAKKKAPAKKPYTTVWTSGIYTLYHRDDEAGRRLGYEWRLEKRGTAKSGWTTRGGLSRWTEYPTRWATGVVELRHHVPKRIKDRVLRSMGGTNPPAIYLAQLPDFMRYSITGTGRSYAEAEAAVRRVFEEKTGGDFGPSGSNEAWEEACEHFGFVCGQVVFGGAFLGDRPWPC